MDQTMANATSATPRPTVFRSFADEALRRVLAAAPIDPREPGLVYDNASGTFEVLAVETPPKGGRRFLIRNLHTHAVHSTGALWTASDRVVKTADGQANRYNQVIAEAVTAATAPTANRDKIRWLAERYQRNLNLHGSHDAYVTYGEPLLDLLNVRGPARTQLVCSLNRTAVTALVEVVLAAYDAPVTEMASMVEAGGNPALIAVAYVAAGTAPSHHLVAAGVKHSDGQLARAVAA
ncbi:hypothetical protein [Streptomyces sp. NPDC088348]|uniref:hypothetical protein n=1 Tax=Streptomyces sp. NPDC088348 TaxID=3365853 RepID=UPI00382EC633